MIDPDVPLIGSELEVNAYPDQTLSEADIDGGISTSRPAGRIAEIHIEVFDPGRPVISQGGFDAGACGPAELCAGGGDTSGRCLHIAVGGAACAVEQHAIRRITGAQAR